jgi:hypothetical protein
MAVAVEASRMDAVTLKSRVEAGDPVTILDARAGKAYRTAREKIRGDIRVDPDNFEIDPAWDRDRVTVVYCT